MKTTTDLRTKLSTIFWFSIFCFLLLSCARTEFEPPVDLQDEYVNQQIKLLVPAQFNSYKTTSPVVLEVQYYSNNDITFPNNYNVRIFKKTSNGWMEIQEQPITRLPEDDIVFSAKKETNAIRLFTVYLELDEYDQPSALRFYIIGDMKVEQEVQQVAAYVDVKLSP